MLGRRFQFLCSHRFYIKPYPFAIYTIIVFVENTNLIESPPDINRAKGFILIELQSILII